MENLLNGKNLDDIEFQPNTAAGTVKNDEFHFGPNAAPFTPSKPLDQSEALSTKAVFGDESSASYMEETNVSRFESTFAEADVSTIPEFHPKSQDPMSTSFYQDREDDSNPFDLNKVHVLPDNLDEFLDKADSSFNDTISDLPSHNPLPETSIEGQAESTQVTDLDKPATSEEPVKTGDLLGDFQSTSPVEESNASFLRLEEDVKSPIEEPEQEICQKRESISPILSPEPVDEVCVRPASQSPGDVFGLEKEPEQTEFVCLRPESNAGSELTEDACLRSPVQQSPSPVVESAEDVCLRPDSRSPLPETQYSGSAADVCLRPESSASLGSQPAEDVCLRPELASPLMETQPTLESDFASAEVSQPAEKQSDIESPLPETQSPIPDVCLRPEPSAPEEAPSPAPSDEICLPQTKSPEPEAPTPEPLGDICQRPAAITPEPVCIRPQSVSPAPPPELVVEQVAKEEISSDGLTSPVEDITSSVKDEVASPVISPIPKEAIDLPAESLDEKEVDSGVDSNESVPQTTNNLNFAQEISNAIPQDGVSGESTLGPDFNSTPKSVISETVDTESVVTADVNSVLEKCNLPDLASPLSVSEQHSESTLKNFMIINYSNKLLF